jgi:integrase
MLAGRVSARRGRGEGSVGRHPDGRWVVRVQINGRRRWFYGRTRAEAVRKLDDAIRNARVGLPIPDERLTVGGYLEAWLASQKPPALRPSTWTAYRFHLRHAATIADTGWRGWHRGPGAAVPAPARQRR